MSSKLLDRLAGNDPSAERSAAVADCFVVTCLFLSCWAYGFAAFTILPPWGGWAISIYGWVRIIDLISYAVGVGLFHHIPKTARQVAVPGKVASKERIVVLGLINYLELMILFGVIYAVFAGSLEDSRTSVQPPCEWTALYFSGITQLTIGYGDVIPKGGLRLVAVMQGLSSLLLLVLLVGRFVSLLRTLSAVADEMD